MRRVLVTGSRKWRDRKTLYEVLGKELVKNGNFILVHGACPTGADDMADQWALWSMLYPGMDIRVEKYPADWSKGKSAGPLRNQQMVDLGADICYAFPTDDSKGTLDCIRRARVAKIPVVVHHESQQDFMTVGGR